MFDENSFIFSVDCMLFGFCLPSCLYHELFNLLSLFDVPSNTTIIRSNFNLIYNSFCFFSSFFFVPSDTNVHVVETSDFISVLEKSGDYLSYLLQHLSLLQVSVIFSMAYVVRIIILSDLVFFMPSCLLIVLGT